MILRTAPQLRVEPDVLRVLERLESQLRRAADDLAAAMADMSVVVVQPEPKVVPYAMSGRCLRVMPRGGICGRHAGHENGCRSVEAMAAETARKHRT